MPPERPVSRGRVLLAAFLDQVVVAAAFLLIFGAGLLLADNGGLDVPIALVVVAAIVSPVLVLTAEIVLIVRTGSSAGLFLLGIRYAPGTPVHWLDDATDWFYEFWPNLILMPFSWIVGGRRDSEQADWVGDPRARTALGRIARVLLTAAVAAGPATFMAALAA